MQDTKTKTVLYFLQDGKRTDADRAAIASINGAFERVKVYLRNGAIHGVGSLEPADYVAGPQVPDEYADYPRIGADGVVPAEEWGTAQDSDFRPSGEGFAAGSQASENAREAQPKEPTLADEIGTAPGNGGWGAPIR